MRKFDKTAAQTAIRTAGALMVGNSFVAPLVLGNKNWLNLGFLLVLGVCVIIAASFGKE